MSRGTVGLGAPEIAGDQDDSVFGYRGGDEGVADGATRDVERCRPGVESFRALGAVEPRAGEVVREQSGEGQANQAAGSGRNPPAGRAIARSSRLWLRWASVRVLKVS
jgi:hypothetical protein